MPRSHYGGIAMANLVLNLTFDGSSEVPRLPGQSAIQWFDAGSFKGMDVYNIFYTPANPGDQMFANLDFMNSDWRIRYMRISGEDHVTTIEDVDNGANRRIELLDLGLNSDVDFTSTRVRHIFGSDGDRHDVKLGNEQSGSTASISLFSRENIVTTGNAYVFSIFTGGDPSLGTLKDTITVNSGGAGQVNTGAGNDLVTINGYANSVITNSGNGTIVVNGAVNFIDAGDGDNTINGNFFVRNINADGGNDRITLNGGGFSVDAGGGNNKITVGAGYVDYIYSGNGNDIIETGSAGVGFIRTGDGNDKIIVNEFNPDFGVVIQAGAGVDTLDFGKFSVGVIFSFYLQGAFQNPGEPTGDYANPAKGYVSAIGFENLWGTAKGDTLTGHDGNNVLLGKGGNDTLHGLAGNDKLDGAAGNDTMLGGAGKDTLIGGKGNDVLQGDAGNDILRGQAGKDVFVFGANSGTDTVKDYVDGADKLRIADHVGGFASLSISASAGDKVIVHDGGTIILDGKNGVTLTATDFDFI